MTKPMTKLDELQALYTKLNKAERALSKIDRALWQPGRKPNTERREATIAALRAEIARLERSA